MFIFFFNKDVIALSPIFLGIKLTTSAEKSFFKKMKLYQCGSHLIPLHCFQNWGPLIF